MLLVLLALLLGYAGREFSAAVIQSEVVALVNNERTTLNTRALVENSLLDAAAQAKAEDMAAKGYFAHVGPGGVNPWSWIEQAGYDYRYAGENLAVRFVDSTETVQAWMASPSHRANIVKAGYTETGVGIADGMYEGQPATFVVQFFASPAEVAREVVAAPTAAAPAVAQAPAGDVAGAAVEPPSTPPWWQRVVVYMAQRLGLAASAALSGSGVLEIGPDGAQIVR